MHRCSCSILDDGTVWRIWRRCSWILFIGKRCLKNDAVKSYREKIVLKTLQLEFSGFGPRLSLLSHSVYDNSKCSDEIVVRL